MYWKYLENSKHYGYLIVIQFKNYVNSNTLIYNHQYASFSIESNKAKKKILSQSKILEIEGLNKIVAKDATRTYLFKDISLEIRLGQKIGLLGVNGSGILCIYIFLFINHIYFYTLYHLHLCTNSR